MLQSAAADQILDSLPDDIWPLCLETSDVHKVCLEEGDGLIYKGVENPHWRDKFEGERLAQVFLHYVRR